MTIYQAGPERSPSVPVVAHDSQPRSIFVIKMPMMPTVGDLWHLGFELHVTNDDLRSVRPNGFGVACVTQVTIAGDDQNDLKGYELLRANGGANVGVQAHHALISRQKWIEWDESLVKIVENLVPKGIPYIKMVVVAKSTEWDQFPNAQLIVDQKRGFMQVMTCPRS